MGGGKLLYSARIIPYRGSWIELEFDSNDILYIRIDRRRKVVATILLRAFGFQSTEEIIKTFYRIEEIVIAENKFYKRFRAEDLLDKKVPFSITDSQGKIIAKADTKITKPLYKKIIKENIDKIGLPNDYLLNKIVAADVINRETGEVIIEGNQKITEDILAKLLENKIERLEIIDETESEIGLFLCESLDKDITRTQRKL